MLPAAAEPAARRPKTAPPTVRWSRVTTQTKHQAEGVQSFDRSPFAEEKEGTPLRDTPEETQGCREDPLVRPSTSAARNGSEGRKLDDNSVGGQGLEGTGKVGNSRTRRQGLEGSDGKGSEEGAQEGGKTAGETLTSDSFGRSFDRLRLEPKAYSRSGLRSVRAETASLPNGFGPALDHS